MDFGYIFWLWYSLFKFPWNAEKQFDLKTIKIFMLCTFYVFATFFTYNTELYLITNYFYILVPIQVICDEEKKGNMLLIQKQHIKTHKKRSRIVLHRG